MSQSTIQKKLSLDEATRLFQSKKKDVSLFVRTCEAIARYRRQHSLTQTELAKKLKVGVRQIKTFEKIAGLPPDAKLLILEHRGRFSRRFLTLDIASRRFADKRTLMNVLMRRVEGKSPRKRPERTKDYALQAFEDSMRERLSTKVAVVGDTGGGGSGDIRIKWMSPDEFERIKELLEAPLMDMRRGQKR